MNLKTLCVIYMVAIISRYLDIGKTLLSIQTAKIVRSWTSNYRVFLNYKILFAYQMDGWPAS